MTRKTWLESLSTALFGLSAAVLLFGVLLTPNVVLADEDPLAPDSPTKKACTGCSAGAGFCPQTLGPNGCNVIGKTCQDDGTGNHCMASGGTCGCDKIPFSNPVMCDCYP